MTSLPYFIELIFLEIIHKKKTVMISIIYRSPSQNNSELDSFLMNIDHLLSEINKCKPSLPVMICDFDARPRKQWIKDVNTTEGSKLLSLTSSNGFFQLISKLTDIQTNKSPCTGLIFTNQPNLSVNSGVHSSPNCLLYF